ncbi:MAG: hypothetical protein AABZ47_04190 [Planctomycetota bacterium]
MMIRKLTLTAIVAFALFLCTGCGEYVGTAARGSLASFLSSIFSNAVNSALAP